MNVDSDFKLELLGVMMHTLMRALSEEAADGEITGDDLLDFFSLGIAAVIDNDSNLKTPRDLRLAADVSKKRIEGRVKEFRAMQEQVGISWLALTLERGSSSSN